MKRLKAMLNCLKVIYFGDYFFKLEMRERDLFHADFRYVLYQVLFFFFFNFCLSSCRSLRESFGRTFIYFSTLSFLLKNFSQLN